MERKLGGFPLLDCTLSLNSRLNCHLKKESRGASLVRGVGAAAGMREEVDSLSP